MLLLLSHFRSVAQPRVISSPFPPSPVSGLIHSSLSFPRCPSHRYPNGNPETHGRHTQPTGYTFAKEWIPQKTVREPDVTIRLSEPTRPNRLFSTFEVRLGAERMFCRGKGQSLCKRT